MTAAGSRSLNAAVCLVVMSVVLSGCRRSSESARAVSAGGSIDSEPASIEDSGRTLSGTYSLKSVEDDYSPQGRLQKLGVTLTFDQDARFRKQEFTGSLVSRTLEGTYVIGTHNELILYVEKVDSQPLDAARIERYVIENTAPETLKLRYDSAGTLTLQKQ